MKKLVSLIIGDFKNIYREFIPLFMTILPILIGVLFRFLIPSINEFFGDSFNLALYYDFITAYIILFPTMLYGLVVGFIILDERDEDIITYFSITPITKQGYLFYRLISPMCIVFVFTFLQTLIINLVETNYLKLIPVMILASLGTPISALFMGSFAENKLEGIAIGKILSIIYISPFFRFIPSDFYKYIGGLFPPFWVTETFLSIYNNELFIYNFIIGIVVTFIWIYIMTKMFDKKID